MPRSRRQPGRRAGASPGRRFSRSTARCSTPGAGLLIRRGNPPFKGAHALPGGFVDVGETVEAACRRELEEETGVKARKLRLVGVYSDPRRDPRGHTCSVVFLARVARTAAGAGDDAAAVEWVKDWSKTELAFDHAAILADAARMLRQGHAGKGR